jgi:hypothetical protein
MRKDAARSQAHHGMRRLEVSPCVEVGGLRGTGTSSLPTERMVRRFGPSSNAVSELDQEFDCREMRRCPIRRGLRRWRVVEWARAAGSVAAIFRERKDDSGTEL